MTQLHINRTTHEIIEMNTGDEHPLIAQGTNIVFRVSLPNQAWSVEIAVADIDQLIMLLRAYQAEVSK